MKKIQLAGKLFGRLTVMNTQTKEDAAHQWEQFNPDACDLDTLKDWQRYIQSNPCAASENLFKGERIRIILLADVSAYVDLKIMAIEQRLVGNISFAVSIEQIAESILKVRFFREFNTYNWAIRPRYDGGTIC